MDFFSSFLNLNYNLSFYIIINLFVIQLRSITCINKLELKKDHKNYDPKFFSVFGLWPIGFGHAELDLGD